jgi:hypothetical protein
MRAEEQAENGEELGLTRVMDNWGGEDWSRTGDAAARSGKQFKMTEAEASKVFGVNEEDQLVERIHGDLARGAKFVAEHWDGGAASTIVGAVTHRIATPARGARGRVVPTVKAQALHKGNGGGGAEGEVPYVLPGMKLSPIGQTEQGATPHDQECPNYGLDETEFLIVGFAGHLWRKTIEIRKLDGTVLGVIKRGCPAFLDAFVYKVPVEHANGCRQVGNPLGLGEDEDVAKCAMPEQEVLYTNYWTGVLNKPKIQVFDCHEDPLFNVLVEERDVHIHEHVRIHSDFVVMDITGHVIGYCRSGKEKKGLRHIDDHNITLVDLDGDEVATAVRPLHWENGATEHVWQVTIIKDLGPNTLSDMRVVVTSVAQHVFQHMEDDWCSDIVYMLTPILLTVVFIALVAGMSAVCSWKIIVVKSN